MISAVMPVRNEERLVARAVRSVLDQTYRDFELIVVDNGSSDRTPEIVERFAREDARVRLLMEPTAGAYAARNRGIAEARHPWIAVQDADDVSHPQRFARSLDAVRRRRDLVVLGSWALVYSERTGFRAPHWHALGDYSIRCQLRTGPAPFVHSSVLMSREACLGVGGYPAGFPLAEDYALWGLLQTKGRLANLPMHLVVYRHQERETGSSYRAEEGASTEALRRRFLRPATRWDARMLRLTEPLRRQRALLRMRKDWPPALLERCGLGALP